MMKNRKRLGNILGAGMMTLLLGAVFVMFGQGLAPLPAQGEFGLMAWAQKKAGLVEAVAAPEEVYAPDKAYEEEAYEGYEQEEAYEEYEAHHEDEHEGYEEDDDHEGHEAYDDD